MPTRIDYLNHRSPDTQYKDMLKFILESKHTHYVKHPNQERGRYFNLRTKNLEFDFENGFPICTERKIGFWKKPITELILFMRGVRKLGEMKAAGCDWWAEWVTGERCAVFGLEEGDLGPGSYGPVLSGESLLYIDKNDQIRPFNQIENLVRSLKDRPNTNTHVVTTWFPPLAMQNNEHERQVVVAPCHGTVIQCTVINGKRLSLTMVQRSGDVPVGVVSNIIQYAALAIMLAHVCGYKPDSYIHKINDAQIYENQVESVQEILNRKSYPYPIVQLTAEGQKITNIFDFTADHFEIKEYEYGPAIKVPYTL